MNIKNNMSMSYGYGFDNDFEESTDDQRLNRSFKRRNYKH